MYSNNEFQQLVNEFETTTNNKTKNNLVLYILKYNNCKLEYMESYLAFKDYQNKNNNYQLFLEDILKNGQTNTNYNNNHEFELTTNRKDEEYKKSVKEMYSVCQVTGYHYFGCEVAHIWEFKDCETDEDKYNKFNGLLLKAQIHKYWDAGYLILNYDENTRSIYFKININKVNTKENSDLFYNDLMNELTIKDINEKAYINYCEEYFNSYTFFIKKRNCNL
jgi:hypothetical protein